MTSIVWFILMSVLFSQVQSDKYKHYYAEDDCNKFKNDSVDYRLAPSGHASSAIIRATRYLTHSYPFNCNISVTVRDSRDAHVFLKVRKISFPSKSKCQNYIKIYQGKDSSYQLCRKDDIVSGKTDFIESDNRNMKFLYHTENNDGGAKYSDDFFSKGFEVLVTAYIQAPCNKDMNFLCSNGRCISKKLTYDGYDNCGDNSDERLFSIRIRLPTSAVTGIIIGILLLIAAIAGCVWIARRKRVTTTRTYTTPAQPLYPTGYNQQAYSQPAAETYPQAAVPYAPYPTAPGAQNQYGGEMYQKSSQPFNPYSGVPNPAYGQPPPPYN